LLVCIHIQTLRNLLVSLYFSSILSATVFSSICRRAPATSCHEALDLRRSHREKVSRFHLPHPSVGWLLSIWSSSWSFTPRLSPSVCQSETLPSSLQRVAVSGFTAIDNRLLIISDTIIKLNDATQLVP